MTFSGTGKKAAKPYSIRTDKNYTAKVNRGPGRNVSTFIVDKLPGPEISTTFSRAPKLSGRPPKVLGFNYNPPRKVVESYESITLKPGEKGPESAPTSIQAQAKAKAAGGGGGGNESPSTGQKLGNPRQKPFKRKRRGSVLTSPTTKKSLLGA